MPERDRELGGEVRRKVKGGEREGACRSRCVGAIVLLFLSLLVGAFGVVQQELGTGRVILHVVPEIIA